MPAVNKKNREKDRIAVFPSMIWTDELHTGMNWVPCPPGIVTAKCNSDASEGCTAAPRPKALQCHPFVTLAA
jgi:hypothetical protein